MINLIEENEIDVQKIDDYICMNPTCKKEGIRFFSSLKIQRHKQCEGWVTKIDEMKDFLMPSENATYSKNQNVFNFKSKPLKSLFEITKIFAQNNTQSNGNNQDENWFSPEEKDPIQLLKFNFNLLRVKIENQLQKVYHQVESRLLKIKNVQQKTGNQMRRILTTFQDNYVVSDEISRSQILKEYQKFCGIAGSFTLIEEEKIKKQMYNIFQSIQNISNSFWKTDIESINREKQLFEKAYKQIEKLHSDVSVHPAIKFLNFHKMFQVKNPQINYSEDKSQVWIKCWICNNQLFGHGKSIKERKINVYENVIDHVTQFHFKETTAKFSLQMVKTSTHRLSYTDFLKQLQEKRYKQFIIVDRQNMSKGMLDSINEKMNEETFIIDVVSMQNQHLAIGKYLTSMSQGKDSADILMIMAIYAIITSGYYRYASSFAEMRKPKIILVSKDHFAETYQEILKSEFGVEIIVIK